MQYVGAVTPPLDKLQGCGNAIGSRRVSGAAIVTPPNVVVAKARLHPMPTAVLHEQTLRDPMMAREISCFVRFLPLT